MKPSCSLESHYDFISTKKKPAGVYGWAEPEPKYGYQVGQGGNVVMVQHQFFRSGMASTSG